MMDTRDRLTELSNKIRSNTENFKGTEKIIGITFQPKKFGHALLVIHV